MSDSELSEASRSPAPPDSELEKSLRREVAKAHGTGEEYTINSIRIASEVKLGLTPGFYKDNETWLVRSKQIIKNQSKIEEDALRSPAKLPKATVASPEHPKKRASEEREPWPRKRKKTVREPVKDASSEELSSPPSEIESESFDEAPQKKSRRKTSKPAQKQNARTATSKKARSVESDIQSSEAEDQDDTADASESYDEKPKKKQAQRKKAVQNSPKKTAKAPPTKKAKVDGSETERDEAEDRKDDDAGTSPDKADAKPDASNPVEDSDSELSVLLDGAPPPKKRQKQKESSGQKSRKANPTKGKPEADLDPDQAEIKRLQGWLVKCGIRKVWGKELKPYETSKAKIKHLKKMLADAGMTGRYSVEKANQIKEARELAADIEAVQEGAERWGADDEAADRNVKDDDGGRPARRLVRGAKNYAFLSSDGEETD